MLKIGILVLSLSLTTGGSASLESIAKPHPTRDVFSYTEKSLVQLLPTPEERVDELISDITSHIELL